MKTFADFPVLILGYMRFDGILRNLRACKKAGICRVYLSLDGAKDSQSQKFQDSELLKIWYFAESQGINLRLRRRHSNGGLAVAVIEGISWFFENEELGAILEDDLDVSNDFFHFAVQALETFQNDHTVALISGNNFQKNRSFHQISATHYPLIWGWATRRNVWNDFMLSLKAPLIVTINWRLPLSVNAFWWTAARQSRDGLVDSWAMSFSNYIRMRNFLCLLPPVNLISNRGIDSYATHSNSSDSFINFPITTLNPDLNWDLPTKSSIKAVDHYLEDYIFGISGWSLFSPLKVSLKCTFFKLFKKRKTLVSRLKISSENHDFSLSEESI